MVTVREVIVFVAMIGLKGVILIIFMIVFVLCIVMSLIKRKKRSDTNGKKENKETRN